MKKALKALIRKVIGLFLKIMKSWFNLAIIQNSELNALKDREKSQLEKLQRISVEQNTFKSNLILHLFTENYCADAVSDLVTIFDYPDDKLSLVKEAMNEAKSKVNLNVNLLQWSHKTYSEQSRPNEISDILVISGMKPTNQHGGGLRLLDIIVELGKDRNVYLIAENDNQNTPEIEEVIQRSVKDVYYVNEMLTQIHMLKHKINIWKDKGANFSHVFFEWPGSILIAAHLRNQFDAVFTFTYMEAVTKSYLMALKQPERGLTENLTQYCNLYMLEKTAARIFDRLIAVTPEDADFINSFTGRRPVVLETCVSDIEVWEEIDDSFDDLPETKIVTFIGYFNHFPNHDAVYWYLDNVHEKVKERIPDYILYIVGAGNVINIKNKTVYDPNVIVTGPVKSVVPYIKKSKVMISPLISGAGIRGKVNQYAAGKRATVATSISLEGLPYQPGISVLKADSADDFFTGVVDLLENPDLNNKLRFNAAKCAVENFKWSNKIKILFD